MCRGYLEDLGYWDSPHLHLLAQAALSLLLEVARLGCCRLRFVPGVISHNPLAGQPDPGSLRGGDMESLPSQQRERGMESPGAAGQPFAAGLGADDACVSFALSSPAHGHAVWGGEQMRRTVSYRGRVAVRYSEENNLRMPQPDKGTEFTKGQSLLPLGVGASIPVYATNAGSSHALVGS